MSDLVSATAIVAAMVRVPANRATLLAFENAGLSIISFVGWVMDRHNELRRRHSEEWARIANEPATDEEIASYKRHEGCDGSCLGCLEKFRLIVRLEAAEANLALLRAATRDAVDGLRSEGAMSITDAATCETLTDALAATATVAHCRSCCYLQAPCDEHKEKTT